MTTPTKEQIEKIMHRHRDEIECGECGGCYVYETCFHSIKRTITEWEKIRNNPK